MAGAEPSIRFFLRGPHDRTHVFTVYTAWLLLLPLVGALRAYLSRRAGGANRAVVISEIFPCFAFFVVLLYVKGNSFGRGLLASGSAIKASRTSP
jgi:hypothetical protein